jgi:RNA polymerase sigma-70 factor, ECF subfamily
MRQGCRAPVRLQYDVPWSKNNQIHRRKTLEHPLELDKFLAGIEQRAFRMAELAIGNRDDALDVLQEAMCKLAEKYADRDPSEWTPLFYRILQNQVRDWYRREKFRNRFRVWFGSQDDDPAELLENRAREMNDVPETNLHNRQMLDKLGCGIRQLPLRQQQAFMLRTFEELDVRQTAKIMGCSEGSVKTHYSRAVHRLRMLLGEFGDD